MNFTKPPFASVKHLPFLACSTDHGWVEQKSICLVVFYIPAQNQTMFSAVKRGVSENSVVKWKPTLTEMDRLLIGYACWIIHSGLRYVYSVFLHISQSVRDTATKTCFSFLRLLNQPSRILKVKPETLQRNLTSKQKTRSVSTSSFKLSPGWRPQLLWVLGEVWLWYFNVLWSGMVRVRGQVRLGRTLTDPHSNPLLLSHSTPGPQVATWLCHKTVPRDHQPGTMHQCTRRLVTTVLCGIWIWWDFEWFSQHSSLC